MIVPEDEEPEGEQWHEKINHEDQTELFSAKPEPEPPQAPPSGDAASDAIPNGANPDTDQEGIQAAQHGEAPFHEVWIPRLRKFFDTLSCPLCRSWQ